MASAESTVEAKKLLDRLTQDFLLLYTTEDRHEMDVLQDRYYPLFFRLMHLIAESLDQPSDMFS